jgi:hypothetical protein
MTAGPDPVPLVGGTSPQAPTPSTWESAAQPQPVAFVYSGFPEPPAPPGAAVPPRRSSRRVVIGRGLVALLVLVVAGRAYAIVRLNGQLSKVSTAAFGRAPAKGGTYLATTTELVRQKQVVAKCLTLFYEVAPHRGER